MPIAAELVDALESGLTTMLATRDAHNVPTGTKVMGAKVATDRSGVTLYVPRAIAARALADLESDPRAAVTFSRVWDHWTIQLKGEAIAREARESERTIVTSYQASYATALELAGIPRRIVLSVAAWPAVALELRVTDLFLQTPGPGAGARL